MNSQLGSPLSASSHSEPHFASRRLERAVLANRFPLPSQWARQYLSRIRRLAVLLAIALLLHAPAFAQDSALDLLHQADALKTSNYPQFVEILQSIEQRQGSLSLAERRYLQYLQGWRNAYDGRYEVAIALLSDFIQNAEDVTLRFRAYATIVNVLALANRYEDAYSQLTQLLATMPQVTDEDAREQALVVTALLYNQAGQYALAEKYADALLAENESSTAQCKAAQLRLEALFRARRLSASDTELRRGVDLCMHAGESGYANVIRSFIARLHLAEGEPKQATALLERHLAEVRESRYPRLVSEFEAVLAQAHLYSGNTDSARALAQAAIANSVKDQFTEPLVIAYRVLFEIARGQQNHAEALQYHERLAEADKGYLDDVSARQIAYQKVRHETLANELEIESLNRQNELLKLERENNRLYIALLISVLGFFALWAYKTKRSQVHFMRLSQRDALTGIANRPHFTELAERTLANDRKSGRETSIVVVDLDYFKAINDRYGHAAGDLVLKQTVETCGSLLRPSDLFGRFGGEEFGILLSGCSLEVARQRCEQMREAVASVRAPEHGMQSNVTASFGVASTNVSGYELRTLLAHADAALYAAKRAGRDRVMSYDPTMGPFVESNEVPAQIANHELTSRPT